MERIGVKLQELDATQSEATITAYMRSRTDPQSIMQSAADTEEQASEAYKSAGSGRRPGTTRMRSASTSATSSSSERGHRHQTRRSSDDSDDDRKPHASTEDDSDDNIDVHTISGKLKVTYMRRKKGEREPKNRETGGTRPLQPTLQQPRMVYVRLD